MRKIEYIVIHHSASDFGDKMLIDAWHRARGFKMIGYHFVILNGIRKKDYDRKDDGIIEIGRNENDVGAHCEGYNENSIGICLIGDRLFSLNQFLSLKNLLKNMKEKYKEAKIVGHCDLDPIRKPECPGFDVFSFINNFEVR